MGIPTDLYKPSLGLLTDLYQLTMACAAWRSGSSQQEAVFNLFFRKNPFGGGYAIACGMEAALDYLHNFSFDEEDLQYLAQLEGPQGRLLFEKDFLKELPTFTNLDVEAVPEGTVVFPHEPLLRIRGPVISAMLAETALLNIVNFSTLIATKAARIVQAAQGEPVLEFGLRRAQGIDGALSASRAAYIGGCSATSNVLAGRMFGIPVRGTHAHSWVMLFDEEQKAFEEYAKALPSNCVFLVDTYDTRQGVLRAIEVGKWLQENGHQLIGVRLDSGDLADLSREARILLDSAGFKNAQIYATNDLDEKVIESLKAQGAAITVWGVGTRLVTAQDDPALGGVYKLAAVRKPGEEWIPRIKISEQPIKTSNPGILQVRRFFLEGKMWGDAIFDEEQGWPIQKKIVDLTETQRCVSVPGKAQGTDLLIPAMRAGRVVWEKESLNQMRQRAQAQLASLPSGVKRFLNPHLYPIGLEHSLQERKLKMIRQARGEI